MDNKYLYTTIGPITSSHQRIPTDEEFWEGIQEKSIRSEFFLLTVRNSEIDQNNVLPNPFLADLQRMKNKPEQFLMN